MVNIDTQVEPQAKAVPPNITHQPVDLPGEGCSIDKREPALAFGFTPCGIIDGAGALQKLGVLVLLVGNLLSRDSMYSYGISHSRKYYVCRS